MQLFRIPFSVVFGVLFSLGPSRAYAHLVNTNVGEFYAGMIHPLTSAEHLLPTLALALLASQCGKQAARRTLVIFPLALMSGILAGSYFTPLGFVHPANLAAIVLLGSLLVIAHRVSAAMVTMVALLTGLILGYRSGVDMAVSKAGYQFIPGVALTGLILVALFAAWIPQASSRATQILRTLCGGVTAVAGMAMLVNAYWGTDFNAIRSVGLLSGENPISLVKAKELSWPIIVAALLGSVIWGAGHAVTPGHGKAIVGAYLVGSRSTPWHAVYLGLTVTLTHTLGIFALGLVALFASRYILPEQLYPWLGALSGLIVLVIGAGMLVSRLRPMLAAGEHDHGHSDLHHHHSHPLSRAEEPPVTWRSLLGLGVSGGLVPCPSALVLLLTAISLGRVGFGMALVVAFSLGMAMILTAVGLLFVKGSRLVQRAPQVEKFGRLLPAMSALIILVVGTVITAHSVIEIIA